MLHSLRSRLTYANVMATIAVFIALGGTSLAAGSLITGKQIKKGAITNRAIKDGTISTKELSKGVRALLRKAGTPGPQGSAGPAGPAGPAGAAGAPGLVRAYAHIAADGSVDQSREHKGVVSSRVLAPSTTCVTLDPSIDAARAVPSVTPDITDNYSAGPNGNIAWAMVSPTGCTGPNEIHVHTGSYGAGQNGGTPVGALGAYFLQVP